MRRPRRSEDFREYSLVKRYSDSERIIGGLDLSGSIGIALIFPSSYDVAGSSLAFHFVRELLSKHPALRVERFFFDDRFERFYSLETLRPLDEFRVWAFSVHFELDVLNVLEILKKKLIPLRWSDRNESHPLIVVGGSMTYFNAESLWEVADAIYNCELEPFLTDFTESLTMENKISILESLSKIPSVSIPPLGKRGILCAKARDIDTVPPISKIVPGYGEFPKTLLVEIGRGCIRRCAFCVAGHTQKPVRFMRIDTFGEILERTPIDVKLGLISATITDYPWLDELLDLLKGKKFSVSSMRADGITKRLMEMLRESGQKSFTIAPEGGSQRIRDVLMKDLNDEDIDRALRIGKEVGFKKVKMYFIYGLEEEREEDLESVVRLGKLAKSLGYDVKLSLNPLIPKPMTPFQNRKIQPMGILRKKERFLKISLKGSRIRHDFESLRESFVQWIIANADGNISRLIVEEFGRSGKKGTFKKLLNLAEDTAEKK